MLIVRTPHSYVPERRYVLDVVLSEWLGFEYDLAFHAESNVTVELAGDPQGHELALPDVFFATPRENWLTERSMPVSPLARVAGDLDSAANLSGPGVLTTNDSSIRPIPALFSAPAATDRPWRSTARGLALAVDLFGSIFYLLTLYEEIVRRTRDRHQRFPASASLATLEGFLDRPIVDEYVDLLWMAMQSLWPSLTRRSSAFRLRLTHDVDEPSAPFRSRMRAVADALAGDLRHRRGTNLARRVGSDISAALGRGSSDPFNTFDLLMDTSERYNLRSTFYFIAGNTAGDIDGNYQLSDPPVARLLRRVHDRGHEVGLHASYGTFRSADLIRAEFEALKAACRTSGFDQPTWGVRQHFLRFENPQTWRSQELAGLDHDSTIGFADQIGFRAGTCREYPAYDLLARRTLTLRERPLLVMDATLFGHLALDVEDAMSRTRAIVEHCRRHGGDAVLLFHNSSLPTAALRSLYRDLVAELVRPKS